MVRVRVSLELSEGLHFPQPDKVRNGPYGGSISICKSSMQFLRAR